MEKIVHKEGKVFLVQDYDMKGFETYIYLGKDEEDPRWFEEVKELKTQKNEKSKKNKKVENIKKEQP